MVVSCCVWGCTAKFRKGTGLGFYRFPKATNRPEQRTAWLTALKRVTITESSSLTKTPVRSSLTVVGSGEAWEPKDWDYVCGRHFITGMYKCHQYLNK